MSATSISNARLYTGIIGAGKTLKALADLVDEIKKDADLQVEQKRHFFADITGLKIDGVLPSPDDWRDAPQNSIIIYDECQYKPWVASARGRSRYKEALEMTLLRKRGIQIWFITQSPRFIHADVKDLIGHHMHLDRPYGAKLSTIYNWNKVEDKPNSRSARDRCHMKQIFTYRKDLYQYYKSVDEGTNHTIKLKLPRKLVFFLLLPFFFFGIVIYLLNRDELTIFSSPEQQIETIELEQQHEPQQANPFSISEQSEQIATDAQQLMLPQPQSSNKIQSETVSIDPIKQQIELNTITGAMSFGDKCKATNKFGHILNITQQQCFEYLKSRTQTITVVPAFKQQSYQTQPTYQEVRL